MTTCSNCGYGGEHQVLAFVHYTVVLCGRCWHQIKKEERDERVSPPSES